MANAIHGHGWRLPWQVTARSDAALTMEYEHRPDPGSAAWPWRYRAWQTLALTPEMLAMTMGIESRAAEPMPAGLGPSSLFSAHETDRVTAAIAGIWWPEAGQLPVERVVPPPAADPRRGVAVDSVALDHGYSGWNGSAEIAWPERRARLAMTADPALSTLVIYSPPERAFFCVEPVSHCVDAFNLAAQGMSDTGMRVLDPGETWEVTVRFLPRCQAEFRNQCSRRLRRPGAGGALAAPASGCCAARRHGRWRPRARRCRSPAAPWPSPRSRRWRCATAP